MAKTAGGLKNQQPAIWTLLNGEILVHRSRRPNRPGEIFFRHVWGSDWSPYDFAVRCRGKPEAEPILARHALPTLRHTREGVRRHGAPSHVPGWDRPPHGESRGGAGLRAPLRRERRHRLRGGFFLKWTTPEPQQFIHQGILAAPETKVRVRPRRPSLARPRRANRLPPPRRSRSRARSPLSGQKPLPRWRARPSGFCPLSPERLPPARPSNPVR